MKIKPISIVLLFMVLSVQAQQVTKVTKKTLDSNIKNLFVGDKVPDILISKIINNDFTSAKISDFKNQLLIFDFWDTGCSSCIEALPKLNGLQKLFGSKIKILPVTWQGEKEILQFFKTNKYINNQNLTYNLPCVVEDNVLSSHFRHQMISHEVWIYKGIVQAITTPEYVNEENIQKILNGQSVNLPIKVDAVNFDINKPLMLLSDNNQYSENELYTYSVLTGHRNGLNKTGGLNFNKDSVSGLNRIAFFNKSILGAYSLLLFNADSLRKTFVLTPGRIFLDVMHPEKYEYRKETGLFDQWQRKNEICYEMVYSIPISQTDIVKRAIKDLNTKIGINGRWEKRQVNCLVFIKNGLVSDSIQPQSKGSTIEQIAFFNFDLTGKFPPAIDETEYKGKINISGYDGTLEDMRKILKPHGIEIKEEKREIEVIVISE